MRTTSRADRKAAALRAARGAMLVSAALLLSYLESFIPINLIIPLPGFRLGLANIIVMFTFFAVSPTDAALVSASRVAVAALLFGSPISFFFSAAGAALSFLGLLLAKYALRGCLSFWGISVLGAALHNAGQISVAALMFGGAVISYFPALLLASALFGSVGGAVLNLLWPRLKIIVRKETAVR